MPIELHIHGAGPLDYGVLADRIVERAHENIRAVSLRRPNRGIQVGHEITRPFDSERVRHGCFESKDRKSSDRRQNKLRHRLARSRSYREDALLRCGPAERGQQAGHKLVEVLRLDIHVSRVVLRADAKVGIREQSERHDDREQGKRRSPAIVSYAFDAPFRRADRVKRPNRGNRIPRHIGDHDTDVRCDAQAQETSRP